MVVKQNNRNISVKGGGTENGNEVTLRSDSVSAFKESKKKKI